VESTILPRKEKKCSSFLPCSFSPPRPQPLCVYPHGCAFRTVKARITLKRCSFLPTVLSPSTKLLPPPPPFLFLFILISVFFCDLSGGSFILSFFFSQTVPYGKLFHPPWPCFAVKPLGVSIPGGYALWIAISPPLGLFFGRRFYMIPFPILFKHTSPSQCPPPPPSKPPF